MSNILILDGYNLFYRARYSGMNRGEYSTIFNFFRGLRPLVEKFNPSKIYCVLEGVPRRRLELLKEYKGQREYHDKDNFSGQRKEIVRILNKGGKIIVSFSNRAFWHKAPNIWTSSTEEERLKYVRKVLIANGFEEPKIIKKFNSETFSLLPFLKNDPFYCLIARKS